MDCAPAAGCASCTAPIGGAEPGTAALTVVAGVETVALNLGTHRNFKSQDLIGEKPCLVSVLIHPHYPPAPGRRGCSAPLLLPTFQTT
jgi:hypothetical protein